MKKLQNKLQSLCKIVELGTRFIFNFTQTVGNVNLASYKIVNSRREDAHLRKYETESNEKEWRGSRNTVKVGN